MDNGESHGCRRVDRTPEWIVIDHPPTRTRTESRALVQDRVLGKMVRSAAVVGVLQEMTHEEIVLLLQMLRPGRPLRVGVRLEMDSFPGSELKSEALRRFP